MKNLFFILTLLLVCDANAAVSCNDLGNWNGNGDDPREKLAKEAKLPSDYYSRYHEDVWYILCKTPNDIKQIDELVDNGYVTALEAESIAKVLGKKYTAKPLSEEGKLYNRVYTSLTSIGICNACSSNFAAAYLANKKDSYFRQLVDGAIGGDKAFIYVLNSLK
jgi:hypothetical protein